MRLLLDTHVLIWSFTNDKRVDGVAKELLADRANDIWVSSVSLWEMAIKIRVGKLKAYLPEVVQAVGASGFRLLDLRPAHLLAVIQLPLFADHRDPFDHLLVAQAIAEDLILMTDDAKLRRYPLTRIGCSARQH